MLRLKTSDPEFARKFQRIVEDRRESGENVARTVSDILDSVRLKGAAALE